MPNTQAMTTSFKTELLNAYHNFSATNPARTINTADTFKAALYLASATVNAGYYGVQHDRRSNRHELYARRHHDYCLERPYQQRYDCVHDAYCLFHVYQRDVEHGV